MNCSFFFWTWSSFLGIQLQNNSPTFEKVGELRKQRWLSFTGVNFTWSDVVAVVAVVTWTPCCNEFSSRIFVSFSSIMEDVNTPLNLDRILKNSTPGKFSCSWKIERGQTSKRHEQVWKPGANPADYLFCYVFTALCTQTDSSLLTDTKNRSLPFFSHLLSLTL